jgi:hypothetical protein
MATLQQPVTLSINDGVGTFTYTDVQIIEDKLTVAETYAPGERQIGNITVRVKGPLAGRATEAALPNAQFSWRVSLVRGARELLNGVVKNSGITYAEEVGEFELLLLADARAEAEKRLEMVMLNALPETQYAALTWTGVEALTDAETGSSSGAWSKYLVPLTNVKAFRLDALLASVLAATGNVSGTPATSLWYKMNLANTGNPNQVAEVTARLHLVSLEGWTGGRTGDHSVQSLNLADYSRTSLTLPVWSGWKLLVEIAQLNGWSVDASYAAFPSQAIGLRYIPDVWAELTGLTDVSNLSPRGGFLYSRPEPWKALMRFSFANRDGEASPETRRDPAGSSPANYPNEDSTPPYPFAVRAGENVNRHDAEVSSSFTLPTIGDLVVDSHTVGTAELATMHGAIHLPLDSKEAFLFTLGSGAVLHAGRAIFRRHVGNNDYGVAFPYHCEHWAEGPLSNYQLSRTSRRQAEATLVVADPFIGAVGDPANGVMLGGVNWLIQNREARTDESNARLVLTRPAGSAGAPAPAFPSKVGPVNGLKGGAGESYDPLSPGTVAWVRWGHPDYPTGRVDRYRVEIYNFGTELWQYVTEVMETQHTMAATGFFDPSNNDYAIIRVRGLAVPGGTDGPWTEIAILAPGA